MASTKIKQEDLKALKELMEVSFNDEVMQKAIQYTLGFLSDNIRKRDQIISLVIDGKLSLESNAFIKVIEELVVLQNEKTSQSLVRQISEIHSQENYSDFITFFEDDKEYYVIGDLHADLNSFLEIVKVIQLKENFDNINLIFLGDYIDRGKNKIELINRIILLKYLLPNNIHLLRGNLELYKIDKNGDYLSSIANADTSYLFNFITTLSKKDPVNKSDYKKLATLYAKFFDSMPTLALFNFKAIKICAMHGGLPRADLHSEDYYGSDGYENFQKLLDNNTKDKVGISQKINMLWSDPYDGDEQGFNNGSEVRYDFSKDQFIAFCKKYDIDMILRAHEQHTSGYKEYFDNRLMSVFSSEGKNLQDEGKNKNNYYDSISPNFIQITNKEIKSININFDKKNSIEIEKEFQYETILENRIYHEKKYKSDRPQKFITPFEDITCTKGVINIIDRYNKTNKKVVVPKDNLIELNHTDLQQFSSISKNLKFKINTTHKIITNLCDLELEIGIGGIFLKKDESVRVDNKLIISMKNDFSLLMTL